MFSAMAANTGSSWPNDICKTDYCLSTFHNKLKTHFFSVAYMTSATSTTAPLYPV